MIEGLSITYNFTILYYTPASGSARISKSGGSEYVNIGTPEETLLETYFVTLSKFNFDRAREQCVSMVIDTLDCAGSGTYQAYSSLVAHYLLLFFFFFL